MEEILASIRRIISEDEEEAGAGHDTSASRSKASADIIGHDAIEPAAQDEADRPDDRSDDVAAPVTGRDADAIPAPRDTAPDETSGAAEADAEPVDHGSDAPSATDNETVTAKETSPSDGAHDVKPGSEDIDTTPDAARDRLATKDVEMIRNTVAAAVQEEVDGAYVDENAASAASEAFRNLSRSVRVSDVDGPGQTLEALVTEMLRPMLKDWLDANLPGIVEEKVEEEVQRIARRR